MPPLIECGKVWVCQQLIHILLQKLFRPSFENPTWKIVGAMEYAVVLYRDKLPEFNNNGKMVYNWFEWRRQPKAIPKIHPTQKPVNVLKRLIEIFTDPGDVVIDPVAGSGTTLRAAAEMGRNAFGFEVSKDFYTKLKIRCLCLQSLWTYLALCKTYIWHITRRT